ncbi:hypothetical protein N7465_000536 [Penicillium sp. CMV-2018d]|nr:hypothetical protein N7465_000536 [Penicillium sp. CMV-2018d]
MHPLPPLSHFPSYISSFGFLVYHLSPAFCSPVPGQPGADWEVKRGTSSPCWIATSSTIYPSSSSILHFIFRFSCLPFIPRLLLTGPRATWCRLGSEERDVVTMSVLPCFFFLQLFFHFFFSCNVLYHLSRHLYAISPATARTSSRCWGPVVSISYSYHLTHPSSTFIPRLLLTGPGETWCRLGSEERDFVTMSVLSFFFFCNVLCHLSRHLYAISPATARTSSWCWGPVTLRGEAKTSLPSMTSFWHLFTSDVCLHLSFHLMYMSPHSSIFPIYPPPSAHRSWGNLVPAGK